MALSSEAGVAATAYLVRSVNPKLFLAGQTLTPAEQARLLRTWYRLNTLRLVSAGAAWLFAERVASRLRSSQTD